MSQPPAPLLFPALSDPTRLGIVELLCQGEQTAGRIAAEFAISRPAVSRHLRVLREAGLVRVRDVGTKRIYALSPEPLADLDRWLTRYRRFWTERMDVLSTRPFQPDEVSLPYDSEETQ